MSQEKETTLKRGFFPRKWNRRRAWKASKRNKEKRRDVKYIKDEEDACEQTEKR